MIKITFKAKDGICWSICENLNYDRVGKRYLLNSVLKNSRRIGPAAQTIAPDSWQIVQIEEA